jgi:hypothetical protein
MDNNHDPLPRRSEFETGASDTRAIMDESVVPIGGSVYAHASRDNNSAKTKTLMELVVRMEENQNKMFEDVAKISNEIKKIREETARLNEEMVELNGKKLFGNETYTERNVRMVNSTLDSFGLGVGNLQRKVWNFLERTRGYKTDSDDSTDGDGADEPRRKKTRYQLERIAKRKKAKSQKSNQETTDELKQTNKETADGGGVEEPRPKKAPHIS